MATKSYRGFRVSTPHKWVAHVELNRPEKLNAFEDYMRFELRDVFDTLSEDPSVRAIILSGSGDKAFSAGLDVRQASKPGSMLNPTPESLKDSARYATRVKRWALDFQDCISSIERCAKPVICVLHGVSFGISIDIACCADIRICSEDTKLSVKEVDIGLAADLGTLTRLPKIVGSYSWVKEVCLTAKVFHASEALQHGFVSNVLSTKKAALEDAIRIAILVGQKSPVAIQGTKNFLDWSRDHNISDGLKYTAVWNGAAVQTEDVPASLSAVFTGTKAPRFENL